MGIFNFKKGNIGNTICFDNYEEYDIIDYFENIREEIENEKNRFIENSFLDDFTDNLLSKIIDVKYEHGYYNGFSIYPRLVTRLLYYSGDKLEKIS